ncbi:MAG TPA: TlpA disulfide reductase family protein [Ktedonobacteraceae bacterium]|nr:TlpA disulfide reductase family protein [Ktedonobacteraceae bacterium]
MSESAENAPVAVSGDRNKRKRRILLFCGVSLINVALLVFLVTQLLTPAAHPSSDPLVGHPAPNFSLLALHLTSAKGTLSLSSFKGRPVVLNFFASWCDPCKGEAPLLEQSWTQMQQQHKDVVFLGVDFHEPNSDATGFLRSFKITYPAVLDADGSVASKYGIVALPGTIFINRDGVVVSKEARELTSQVLSSDLKLIA